MIEKVVTLDLDYRKIQDVESLLRWAAEGFGLPLESGESVRDFTYRLYRHIGRGTIGYTIIERNIPSRTAAVDRVISTPREGWKSALVSGIAHDYGLHLTFSEA